LTQTRKTHNQSYQNDTELRELRHVSSNTYSCIVRPENTE